MWRCYAFYTHGGRYFNPFVPKEVFDKNENGDLDLLEGKTNDANEKEVVRASVSDEKENQKNHILMLILKPQKKLCVNFAFVTSVGL